MKWRGGNVLACRSFRCLSSNKCAAFSLLHGRHMGLSQLIGCARCNCLMVGTACPRNRGRSFTAITSSHFPWSTVQSVSAGMEEAGHKRDLLTYQTLCRRGPLTGSVSWAGPCQLITAACSEPLSGISTLSFESYSIQVACVLTSRLSRLPSAIQEHRKRRKVDL